MLYMGVDLGGTGIKAGVVSENGEILSKGSTPTMKERPYQDIIRDIASLCEKVAGQANVTMDEIAAIGVGVPGICDAKTGIIPFCTNLGWHDVPFIAEMHKYLPNRVIVDNDATVAGYAESIAGVSRGTQSSVFITLGTGVGGGIVIGGRPYSGVHGIGSEIGHMIIKMDGEPCTCGNRGCWERYASATALRTAASGLDPALTNGHAIFQRLDEPEVRTVVNAWLDQVAAGAVSLIHVFNIPCVVLGGGVMEQPYAIQGAQARIEKLLIPGFRGVRVVGAALGNMAGLYGAAQQVCKTEFGVDLE